jgi:hypothetical protein
LAGGHDDFFMMAPSICAVTACLHHARLPDVELQALRLMATRSICHVNLDYIVTQMCKE